MRFSKIFHTFNRDILLDIDKPITIIRLAVDCVIKTNTN